MKIPFFDRIYRINNKHGGNDHDMQDMIDQNGGRPTDLVAEVIQAWLCAAPHDAGDDTGTERRLLSYRDLPGAGPLAVSFANNINKTLTQAYGGRRSDLAAACGRLGGRRPSDPDLIADLAVRFEALPRIWLYLVFNDQEDGMPAQCSLLFNESALGILPSKALFALGTYLTGRLVVQDSESD